MRVCMWEGPSVTCCVCIRKKMKWPFSRSAAIRRAARAAIVHALPPLPPSPPFLSCYTHLLSVPAGRFRDGACPVLLLSAMAAWSRAVLWDVGCPDVNRAASPHCRWKQKKSGAREGGDNEKQHHHGHLIMQHPRRGPSSPYPCRACVKCGLCGGSGLEYDGHRTLLSR